VTPACEDGEPVWVPATDGVSQSRNERRLEPLSGDPETLVSLLDTDQVPLTTNETVVAQVVRPPSSVSERLSVGYILLGLSVVSGQRALPVGCVPFLVARVLVVLGQ
jgi:hypothetical protein